MSELYETKPIPGFHILADCDTRANVVAFFDGIWWLPGSNLPFGTDFVSLPDEPKGGRRFTYVSAINVPEHAYGPWEVENGRYY